MHQSAVIVSLLAASVLPGTSLACGFQGNASRTDGSQVDGTARVSSSWNSQQAYPRGGFYTLDLGDSACGESVELYINGQSLGRHRLPGSGNLNVDFVLKGSSDTLVR